MDYLPPIRIPISTEEEARERFKRAKICLAEALARCADEATEANRAAVVFARTELATASMFTH